MALDNQFVEKQLDKRQKKAEVVLNDPRKLNRLLQRCEKKLERLPKIGKKLSSIPVFIELIIDYKHKEYTDIPVGTIIALLAAIICFVVPFDAIPDFVPIIGYVDDAAVVALCYTMFSSDIEEYKEWRRKNGRIIV